MFEKLFSNTGLSLIRLKIFCEIAAAKGISKAAKGNSNNQSHYSRELKRLEEFLEVRLFERKGKGMEITEAGKRLLPVCKEFLRGMEILAEDFRDLPRRVVIGAGDSTHDWLVLPRFDALKKILPNTIIELINLRSAEVNTGVLEGDLDLGIVRENACSPELGVCKLGTLCYCLFVPRQLWSKAKTSDPVELLAKLPLARLAGDGEFNQMLARLAKKKKIVLNTQLTCSSFPAMKETVRRCYVAAVLPTIAEVDLPRSEFEKFDVDVFRVLDRSFALCYNKRLIGIRPYLEQGVTKLKQLFTMP
jgi:LysR family nitrogen assimilation transcriptional regulator